MGNPEILVGKPNGSCHCVWEASENLGCDLRGCNCFSLYSVHHVQLYIFMFMHKISIRVACVNGELAVILPAGAELMNVCVGSEGELLSEEEAGLAQG